jgi:hypothetical protein
VTRSKVKPSLKKIRKSIRLSTFLWNRIDLYAERFRLNRSQVIERGMMFFLSDDINDLLAERDATRVKLAMLEQQIKNKYEKRRLKVEV